MDINIFRSKNQPEYTDAIDDLLLELQLHKGDSSEYARIVEQMEKLAKLHKTKKSLAIDPNTALTVAANIVGIILVLKHEQLNVIASKAFGLVMKAQ